MVSFQKYQKSRKFSRGNTLFLEISNFKDKNERGGELRPHIIFCIMSIISVVLQDIILKIGDSMLFLYQFKK